MSLLSSTGAGILRPEDVQALVVQPLQELSTAMQVSSVVRTGSHETRFPVIKTDAVNAWTAEGAEINVTDPDVDELIVTPKKVAGLVIVSNEMVLDSDPAALQVVGDGLVRDLQLKIDAAYFGNTIANGPDGIASLADVQTVDGGTLTNLDAFAEAISLGEQVGAPPTAFVANPADVLAVSTLKVAANYNQPLLGVDATNSTKRSVLGVPLYSSPAVTAGTVWGIAKPKSFVVMRTDPSVVVDSSVKFTSDQVAVRCTLRIGFGWPHEKAVTKITFTPATAADEGNRGTTATVKIK